jgi:hypothetical protein
MSKDKQNPSELTSPLESKTNADVLADLAALELEEKQLDLEIKRESVAKIRAQRENKLAEHRAKMVAVVQFLAQRKAIQEHCNHRKGGIGAGAVINGEGSDPMYSIFKHKLPDGKYMVLCSRCGREWRAGNKILNIPETPGFSEAINWPTDNSPSGSSTFLFERVAAV